MKPVHSSLVLLPLLAACSNNPYSVTLNDNVLYSPFPAQSNRIFVDSGLQGCLNQLLSTLAAKASEDESDTEAESSADIKLENIRSLVCPEAGIRSLQGITALSGLEELELSNNLIDNVSHLQPLRNLRTVNLSNNRLRNIGPLTALPLLSFASLEGNNDLPCRQLDELGRKPGTTLNRPANCR
jgi:Leucine-rich repeat (LRR) protein